MNRKTNRKHQWHDKFICLFKSGKEYLTIVPCYSKSFLLQNFSKKQVTTKTNYSINIFYSGMFFLRAFSLINLANEWRLGHILKLENCAISCQMWYAHKSVFNDVAVFNFGWALHFKMLNCDVFLSLILLHFFHFLKWMLQHKSCLLWKDRSFVLASISLQLTIVQ